MNVGEGIVTVQEQDVIVAAFASRTRTRADGVKFPVREPAHLLTGLLYCAVEGCGTRMSMSGHSYVCHGVRLGHVCPGARAMATPVERVVVDAFLGRAPKAIVNQWDRIDVPGRRSLLSTEVDRIWVTKADGRGRRFDPAKRLRIEWAEKCGAE